MSLVHAFNDASVEPQEARRHMTEYLKVCLAELDRRGEMVAAAHLSACLDALNSARDDDAQMSPNS